jgi:hypothetical protein
MRLAGFLHDDRALNRAHDVQLQGNVAFVAGKGGSLALIDVSRATAPRLISALVDAAEYEDAETVLPMGDVLLLGARDFFAIDIRDVTRPRVLRKISDRPRIDRINGMALRGTHLFTANKSGFVGVFDVREPANPLLAGVLDARAHGQQMPHDVAVRGDHIVVANTDHSGQANVQVYRVAESGTHELLPAARWKVEGTIPGEGGYRQEMDLRGANRVTVWGGFGAVGAFVPDRVGILEFAVPGGLRQIANMPVCDIDATGMTVSGSLLFVSGGECVEAIDISNPFHPVSVAQYRGGQLFPTRRLTAGKDVRFDNGHDLVYRDGFLYVTAQNDNRLGILELLDPRLRALAAPRR